MTPNIPEDDRHLRERFAALRREDARQAPDFATTLQRKPARGEGARWLRPAAAAALIVVMAIAAARFYSRPHVQPAISITEWKSPTDFLLETSGHELLESVPQIGEWPERQVIPSASPSPSRKKAS